MNASTLGFLKNRTEALFDSDNSNRARNVEILRTEFNVLGFDDIEKNPVSEALKNLQLLLGAVKDNVTRAQIRQLITTYTPIIKEFTKRYLNLLDNKELIASKDLFLQELQSIREELKDIDQIFLRISSPINNAIQLANDSFTSNSDRAITQSQEKIMPSMGTKYLLDDASPTGMIKLEVKDKDSQLLCKEKIRAQAKRLALMKLNNNLARNWIVNGELAKMNLSKQDQAIFWSAYNRYLYQASPGVLYQDGKNYVINQYIKARNYATNKATVFAGKTLNGAGVVLSQPFHGVGFLTNKLRKHKKVKRDSNKNLISEFGKQLVNKISQNVTRIITTVRTGVNAGLEVTKLKALYSASASALGKTKNFVVATAQKGGQFVGGGFSAGGAAGTLLFVTGALNPATLPIAIGVGVAGGALNVWKNSLMAADLAKAPRGVAIYSNSTIAARGLARASTGVFWGSIVGMVVGGPAGAIAGAIGGGVGLTAAQAGYDKFVRNPAVTSIEGSTMAKAVGNLPLQQFYGGVQGNLWLQSMVKIGLGDSQILQKLGINKNLKANASEKFLYDPRNRNTLELAMTLGLNTFQGYMYFRSLIGLYGGLGAAPNLFANALNIVSNFGFMPARVAYVLRGGALYFGELGNRLAITGAAARYTFIGTAIGSVIGILAASALGLNVGIAAAIGGVIGGATGGFIGGVITSETGGWGALPGAVIGSGLGTTVGAWIDTKILGKVPKLFNPLVLFQGIMDVLKFFNTPIRSLSDYATIGMAAIGIVNFFVAITYFTGSPSVQNSSKKDDKQQQTESHVIYTGAQAGFDANYKKLELNKQNKDIYTFENFEEISELANNQIVIKDNGKYWLIKNPGKYVYNEDKKTLAGKSQNVTAEIFTTNPEIYAEIDVKNGTNKTTSQVLGESIASNSSDKQLHQLSFCQVYLNLCTE